MKTLILMLIFSSFIFADDFEKEAKEVLQPLKRSFQKELKAGLKKGPYDTVDICHLKAPHLAEGDYNEKFEFGRTSLKIRNKTNAPKDWLTKVLEEYKDSNLEKPMSGKVVKVGDKKAYVEPIYIQQVCLKCHGELKGSVEKRINQLYPEDMAKDYKFGEFRGLFWLKER